MTDPNPMSADPALAGALDTLHRLDDLGEYAYSQNAMPLITEAAARAAIADAVTNRIRLLRDMLRDNLSDDPLFLSAELDARYSVELVRLLTAVTGGGDRGEA